MNHNGILPDTCAWIEFFRSRTSPLGNTVRKSIEDGNAHICGPVLFELLQGVKSNQERASILEALRCLEYHEMAEDLWMKSADLAAACKKRGKAIPMSDILIATIAVENHLSVLTVDRHFREIPGITVQTK